MSESETMEAQLPLDDAGTRLKRAREAAGLSLADIAARTKIAERHVGAIEEGRYADLPARMYAAAFSRTIAREVGLDPAEIVAAVRSEVQGLTDAPEARSIPQTFEPGDPARVPPMGLALIAALAALVVVLGGLVVWRSYWAPAMTLPSLAPEENPAPAASTAAAAPAPAAVPAGGAVVFTALEAGIWVKFYDASGAQLMQKQLALGETYTVPAEAQGPQIWTARPDALAITVGGQNVPKLSDVQVAVKDRPVSAGALLARSAGVPAAAPVTSPAAPVVRSTPRPRPQPASRDPRIGRTATDEVTPVGATPAASPATTPAAEPAQPSTVSE